MNHVERVQPSGLPLSPAQPASSRLTLLRQQREQRRQRARWLSSLLLVLGLAFVVQGFVARESLTPDEAIAKSQSRAVRPVDGKVKARPAQPQATAATPAPH